VNGYVAARLKALTGVPFLVTDHSFEEIEACYRFPRRRATYEYVAENASYMIGVCARMERQIGALLPAARTRTVHNGFPDFQADLLLQPRPVKLREKLVVFSAGMFYTRKNFPLLIDVFAEVSAAVPNAILRIAGDGAEMELVKNKVAEHQLQGKVELLGLMPRTRVLQEVAWSDVFALIGRDEPFGVVFLEAMSAAVPIVCCSDCGITDIVTGGRDAMIVPPGNRAAAVESLSALLGDEALRKRIGAAGLELFRSRLRGSANAAAIGELIHAAIGKPAASDMAA
jgi:glycosyltransferase involved in cell wall biosynthesis